MKANTKSTPVLEAQNLSRRYGHGEAAFVALQDVNLRIAQGEAVAIVGKSGSGKSTLMHLLALLDTPTRGVVLVNGKDATRLARVDENQVRNRDFGFVFQQFFLNGDDTVLNNVLLPLKIAGVASRQRKQRALEVLESVDLADKASNKAKDLSGGQKQRLCIARALINNPKVIFADEPTGNLDSATGKKIVELLFRLQKENGITLIIVTHDADLANHCQRQVYIKDGKIVQERTA